MWLLGLYISAVFNPNSYLELKRNVTFLACSTSAPEKKKNKKKNKNKSKNEQTGTRLYVLEVKIFVWKQEMKQNVTGLILDSSYSLVLIKRFKGIKNYFVLLCEFGVKIQKHFQIK